MIALRFRCTLKTSKSQPYLALTIVRLSSMLRFSVLANPTPVDHGQTETTTPNYRAVEELNLIRMRLLQIIGHGCMPALAVYRESHSRRHQH